MSFQNKLGNLETMPQNIHGTAYFARARSYTCKLLMIRVKVIKAYLHVRLISH